MHVLPASGNDAAPLLKLGVANGGTEIDGIAGYNPAPTGTVGVGLTAPLGGALPGAIDASAADRKIKVSVTASGTTTGPFEVVLLPHTQAFATKEDLRAGLQNALQSAAAANPVVGAELLGTQVTLAADHLVVTAGGRADTTISIVDDAADHCRKADRLRHGGGDHHERLRLQPRDQRSDARRSSAPPRAPTGRRRPPVT